MVRLIREFRDNRLLLPTVLLLLGGISYGSLFTANKIAIDAGFRSSPIRSGRRCSQVW